MKASESRVVDSLGYIAHLMRALNYSFRKRERGKIEEKRKKMKW